MTSKSNRFKERNKQVRDFVQALEKKNPHWKYSYVLSKASKKFFLAKRTIEAIIKEEGIYA